MKYDLEKRTTEFGKTVIRFAKNLKTNLVNENILRQVLKSSTSVGANYREANGAASKKDFQNKIAICRKEIQETKYWLELLAEAEPNRKDEIGEIWKETQELTLIFGKITATLKSEN